jgi:hypothetical protein
MQMIILVNAGEDPLPPQFGPSLSEGKTLKMMVLYDSYHHLSYRAFAIRNMDYGHNPVGPDFFGLRKNTIAKMIQDLPNADKCKNYIWQNFEAMTSNKGKSSRRSKLSPPSDTKDEEEETGSLEDKKV